MDTSRRVRDIMTRDLVSVLPDTPLQEVARTLARHHLPGISVVDERGLLVGFISESDVIGTLVHVKYPGGGLFLKSFLSVAVAAQDAAASPAKDHMTTDVASVTEDDDLQTLAELMLSRGYKIVPVTRDERLIGFVNRADLSAHIMDNVDATGRA